MRFQAAFDGWTQGRLTQAKAALLLGQCERSFRRHIEHYRADGLEGHCVVERDCQRRRADQVTAALSSPT